MKTITDKLDQRKRNEKQIAQLRNKKVERKQFRRQKY